MTELQLKELQEKFNLAKDEEQLKTLLPYKAEVVIILDNDNTTANFTDDALQESRYNYFSFKNDFGNRSGVQFLLTLLGFNSEHC